MEISRWMSSHFDNSWEKRIATFLLLLLLVPLLTSCGVGSYYTFEPTNKRVGQDGVIILSNDLLQVDLNTVWYSVPDSSSTGNVYLVFRNKGTHPVSIEDIVVSLGTAAGDLPSFKMDEIEVIGVTRKDQTSMHTFPARFKTFGEFSQADRTLNPHLSASDLKRVRIEVQTPSYKEVSTHLRTVNLLVQVTVRSRDGQMKYESKVSLDRVNHHYPWVLRDG